MNTNRFINALTVALLLAAGQTETQAASYLGDGTLDNLPAGFAPNAGVPAGRWHFSNNSSWWEMSPGGISIAPSPAGGTGNALRYNLSANFARDRSVAVLNDLARSVSASSGPIDMSFDIYVEPGAGGPSLVLDSNGGGRAVQLTWYDNGRLASMNTATETTLVSAYPRGVWQTVRVKLDMARQRYDFEWGEKGQPATVTHTNLALASRNSLTSVNQFYFIQFVSHTWAVRSYMDNIQVNAGPPASVTPAQSIVAPGGSVTLAAKDTLPVVSTYQWQFNGTDIPGATTAKLALSNLTVDQSGPYSVIVSNAFEVVTATAAQVEVVDRVTIAKSPISTNVAAGGNVTLSVTAAGPLPIAYQWQFNGTDLPGQTEPTLTLNNAQLANDGLYTVVATDALRSVTSDPAAVRILIDPVIIQAPISQSVVAGGSVTFSTEITGNPAPFHYQWRQGSTVLADVEQSERQAFFTLNNVQASQAGPYRLVITNPAFPALNLSADWDLTVLSDTDGDGLPDAWETTHGLSASVAADASLDTDGDGQSNASEYRSGTIPTDATSCLKLDGVTRANGTASVSFNAASNQTYTVEWSADLRGAVWTKLADIIARPDNRTETVIDGNATDAARFYRVISPRRP